MRALRADRDPAALPTLSERTDAWSLHNGYMRLFIVGPGMAAWFPITAPDSSRLSHGTPEERHIARIAMAALAIRFRDEPAQPRDIREELEKAGWIPDELTYYKKAITPETE